MNYLSVENVSKSFGEHHLFKDIAFGINKDQKIGFVAKNGTGKTSLLNIIAGLEAPDSGQVVSRKGIVISFLPQEPDLDPNLTVEETIFAHDNPILKTIANYEKALLNMEDADAYQKAFDAMEAAQAWDFETQYKQILFKLKLDDMDRKVELLSGGQKKRLALAQMMLTKPDLAILDEPTNHLDLEMIEWLEEYFRSENITLFMVTHDRYFLENVCNEIVELEGGVLYSYKGNYAYYLENKDARVAAWETETGKAKQLYKKELEWMRRQPKARTTKSKSRIDDFAEIKSRAHERRNDHTVQLEINMERMGSKILEFHKISKSFGDLKLLDQFEYVFKTGERVGIIGKNGTGKTTFLNMITGELAPDSGKVIVGETVKFGYYTQKGINIKEGQKVIDVIKEYGDHIPLKKGRTISAGQLLERFLFDRKKQYDFVERLSGGERKRLYLCTIFIQNPNFLILDEPTNDLDVVTLNVLEQFLLDFPGCLVVVSHDRYFMDKIVDHLFVFKGDAVVEDFPGNYSDFRAYEGGISNAFAKAEKEQAQLDNKLKFNESMSAVATETKSWKEEQHTGTISFNEQKEHAKLEREIAKLEREKEDKQKLFLNPDLTQDQITEESLKLQKIIDAIALKEERWFELSSKMEG
ncbi:ABC-F family ATP-binding cassette domain-containing protein [uncultured Dokdonia sp.]|uniref:ABC-F family ATP-binding cassette domain-containing protein n=1 Tax=Dokdonia sp. R78006 TaxID=3093866 RepID=UPI00262F5AE4|nr:ABC-F family ATP-binding cassette domain-containing protein [uncultured Dokdonia sp.]